MIIRYLSSAGIGIAVTTALLWTMNALIDMGKPVQTEVRTRHLLDTVRVREDTEVELLSKRQKPIADPLVPPTSSPPLDRSEHAIPVGVPFAPETPPGPDYRSGMPANIDSGLINIINAQPDYPTIASGRGLEGYVVVQFDVTEMGTIENVQVVETSNSIFNKAAVKAAYRSKYKPKTVDGVSYRSEGLRKLYRFEMPD